MPSTVTLLGLANTVLLSLNERPLQNLSGLQGAQLSNIIEQALIKVSQLSDWDFLNDTRTANIWQAGRAVLDTDVQRIKGVYYAPPGTVTQRRLAVPFVSREHFYTQYDIGLTYSGSPATGWPMAYTMDGWNVPVLHPYPSDVTNQQLVFFDVIRFVSMPTADNDVFDMPQFFIPLLTRRCSAEYALRHMEDAALASQFNQEFEVEAQALRDRHHRGGNQRNFNMRRRY